MASTWRAVSVCVLFGGIGCVAGSASNDDGNSKRSPSTDGTVAEVCEPATTTAEPWDGSVVFVSRAIPPYGTIYGTAPKGMPGVGPYSRFQIAGPGKLLVRTKDGTIRALVDGSRPSDATLNLYDVNAPHVSYDGKTIVFAAVTVGDWDEGLEQQGARNPSAWRIYTIGADGSNLRQVTFTEDDRDTSQFGPGAGPFQAHDDTDPVFLPDGRIVFSSTRWASEGHYSGVRTSNLFVVNADGSDLHRITSERNGADRPEVDPKTGKVVYSRWWRNAHFPYGDLERDETYDNPQNPGERFRVSNGLTTDRSRQCLDVACTDDAADLMFRNGWHLAAINPDGTGLAMWGGTTALDSSGGGNGNEQADHAYGGAFTRDGDFIANYFPLPNMTEAGNYGGLRRYRRGPGSFEEILGISSLQKVLDNPTGVTFVASGPFATEPDVLPDGRLLLSYAADVGSDYGIYTANLDGSDLQKLYDGEGTTELRARALAARPKPPVLCEGVTSRASALPPKDESKEYEQDGTWVFDALNVYFNAEVDSDVTSAIPVGSAATIRFFANYQRRGFQNTLLLEDFPIELDEQPVDADGAVRAIAPAHLPLFEQIRSRDGSVPVSAGGGLVGAAHVAGLNFSAPLPDDRPVRCVGCHAGHTMIPVPKTDEEARWTNLAPGATVVASSNGSKARGVNDRRVMKGEIYEYWSSDSGKTSGEWIELRFPVPVTVREVRMYNPRQDANCSVAVERVTVSLFEDEGSTRSAAPPATAGPLNVRGTSVKFGGSTGVVTRVVRVRVDSVSGRLYGAEVASVAEVEVIARGGTD